MHNTNTSGTRTKGKHQKQRVINNWGASHKSRECWIKHTSAFKNLLSLGREKKKTRQREDGGNQEQRGVAQHRYSEITCWNTTCDACDGQWPRVSGSLNRATVSTSWSSVMCESGLFSFINMFIFHAFQNKMELPLSNVDIHRDREEQSDLSLSFDILISWTDVFHLIHHALPQRTFMGCGGCGSGTITCYTLRYRWSHPRSHMVLQLHASGAFVTKRTESRKSLKKSS